ncbi:MAG: hypothetical protein ACU84J_10985 [Gammaproteobacteria bacterium]
MNNEFFGLEQMTDDDRDYQGSRYSVVRDAVFANPYQKVWGRDGEPPMPAYTSSLATILRGALPFGKPYFFKEAVKRAVDSHADLRWGEDNKGFRRIVHPNGICLTGLWQIDEDTGYTGYFAKGSRGLLIARYSTCCNETRRGQTRSLSLVGKLYPTTDPEHPEPLRTASFITQQDLGGDHSETINDAELRNAPDTRAWRRGAGVPAFMVVGLVFNLNDKQPSIRQLYQVAELGKAANEATRAPEFMRLRVAPEQPRITGDRLDFRDEIMAQIYDPGDPAPKRKLVFHIEVTDQGKTHGMPAFQRRTFENWRRIGTMTFDDAVASYNGDFVVHFNHPTWRADRNDPSTATRMGERKIG